MEIYNFAEINNLSKINKPLLVKYDLEKLKSFTKGSMSSSLTTKTPLVR